MSNDKLPTRYNNAATAPSPVDRPHSHLNDQSLIGRVWSAFVARLNRNTIERNTEELQARARFAEARGALADAALASDRKVEHYRRHRDGVIRDDHKKHLDQMAANRQERVLVREEREHQAQLERERRAQELNKAKRATAQSQWGLDAFQISVPYRKERIEHISRQGTAEAAGDVIAVLRALSGDDEQKETPAVSRARTLEEELAYTEKLIDEWQDTATPEQMHLLYKKRAELRARIEEEKSRSS